MNFHDDDVTFDSKRRFTVVTNLPAPYRDGVFSNLQKTIDARIILLGRDEPGRGWLGRLIPYTYRVAPGLKLRRRGGETIYVPLPIWLLNRGLILCAGFGVPAIISAALIGRRTLIWSEATVESETMSDKGLRRVARRWIAKRCIGGVGVGQQSCTYLERLGFRKILLLENTLGKAVAPEGVTASRHGRALIHVGKWSSPRKGADQATAVWGRVREQVPNCKFVILGEVDGAPVPDRAQALGFIAPDAVWSLALTHGGRVLLYLSEREHWGYSLHEAMSVGIVPIARPGVQAAQELLADIAPELIVDSVEEASKVAARLMEDDDEWARLSELCRARAQQRTSELVVQRFREQLSCL